MRNTLGDLNNYLFETIERLNDDELTGQALTEELQKAKAITNVAAQIINNGNLALKAEVFKDNRGNLDDNLPHMLGAGGNGT